MNLVEKKYNQKKYAPPHKDLSIIKSHIYSKRLISIKQEVLADRICPLIKIFWGTTFLN